MADGAVPDLANEIAKEMGKLKIETWRLDKIKPYDNNPRRIGPEAINKVAASIAQFGFNVPIVVDELGVVLAGHTRLQALKHLGVKVAAVIVKRGLNDAQKRAWRIADNRVAEESVWDTGKLQKEMQSIMDANLSVGFDSGELAQILNWEPGLPELNPRATLDPEQKAEGKGEKKPVAHGSLAERFGVPPFSVLNASDGWWRNRKKAWMATGLGDNREAGRGGAGIGAKLLGSRHNEVSQAITEKGSQTSTFDPVLCELVIRWFCPAGGVVLDPFAGGPTAGIVASHLGRQFIGLDVRAEQVEANQAQAGIAGAVPPEWIVADSRNLESVLPKSTLVDLVFSCPPYADLEVYSDDPADVSNMDYPAFLAAYEQIIAQAAGRLKPARFAVIVVGEARNAEGHYRGLVPKSIEVAERAGLRFYGEAILVTEVGSLCMRAARSFATSRKFGKRHQQVLVFVNGDPRVAAEAIGECEFGEIADPDKAEEAAE